jgi:hypothetical protein
MKLTDKAKAVFDEITQKLLNNDVGGIVDFAAYRVKGGTPMQNWSILNQLMCLITTGSEDCRGIDQWRKVDRFIKKGSHATYILVPLIIHGETEDDKTLVGFKSVPVFPDHATDGKPIEKPEPPARLPALMDTAKKYGINVTWKSTGRALGYIDHEAKEIALGITENHTFYHELAHGIRIKEGWFKENDRPGEEVIAQVCSCVCSQLLDSQDVTAYTSKYVQSWAGSVNKLVSFLNEIGKTLDLMLA